MPNQHPNQPRKQQRQARPARPKQPAKNRPELDQERIDNPRERDQHRPKHPH